MLKVLLLLLVCSACVVRASDPALFQVIHNSADTSMGLVDIYLNGTKILGKMAFRTATPFVPVASENAFQLAVTRSGSVDTLLSLNYRPEPGIATTFLLHGVTDTTKYHANPDGKSIQLQWTILENISMNPLANDEVAVKIADGCTDIATSNLIAKDVAPLLPSMGFGGSSPATIIMPPTSYEFLLVDPVTRAVVFSRSVNLSKFAGMPIVLFFSGFAESQKNSGGMSLGIYAALHDGTVENIGILTSLQEIMNKVSLNVYTSGGKWMIRSYGGKYKAEIYSILGEKVQTLDCENGDMTPINLERGVYLLNVTGNGKVVLSKLLLQE